MSSFDANRIVPYFWDIHRIWCRQDCEKLFDFWYNIKWLIALWPQPVVSKKISSNVWRPHILVHLSWTAKSCATKALTVSAICWCPMRIIADSRIGFYRCSMKCWPTKNEINCSGHLRRWFKGKGVFFGFIFFLHPFHTHRLGERINDESSIYYWAAKNKIPVFSPALTDGSLGDMLYFHSYRNPGLVVDIVSDLRRLNTMAVKACNSGIIIAGGGLIKHHICNANLMVSTVMLPTV